MIIISYLINLVFGTLLYAFFWVFCRTFFSPNTNSWIMYIMFGIGALLLLSGFGLLKGGDSDGRFRTGRKGNVLPNLPGGCLMLYIGFNFVLIGWGYIFLKDFSTVAEIISYLKDKEWGQMNLFVFITPLILIINGFMIPISELIISEE